MGAKQTKIDGCNLEDYFAQQTANTQATNVEIKSADNYDPMDPRSPAGCRTPINVSIAGLALVLKH